MGLPVKPHIDTDVQYGPYTENPKFWQNLGIDKKASCAIVLNQTVSKYWHLFHGKNCGNEENLGATVPLIESEAKCAIVSEIFFQE